MEFDKSYYDEWGYELEEFGSDKAYQPSSESDSDLEDGLISLSEDRFGLCEGLRRRTIGLVQQARSCAPRRSTFVEPERAPFLERDPQQIRMDLLAYQSERRRVFRSDPHPCDSFLEVLILPPFFCAAFCEMGVCACYDCGKHSLELAVSSSKRCARSSAECLAFHADVCKYNVLHCCDGVVYEVRTSLHPPLEVDLRHLRFDRNPEDLRVF